MDTSMFDGVKSIRNIDSVNNLNPFRYNENVGLGKSAKLCSMTSIYI